MPYNGLQAQFTTMLCLVHIQVGSLLYNYGQQGMERGTFQRYCALQTTNAEVTICFAYSNPKHS